MNLVGHAFKSPFANVNNFVMYFSRIFFNAGARKGRFLTYMNNCFNNTLDATESDSENNKKRIRATMPPNPVATRWNSWLQSVIYHEKCFGHYKQFFENEMTFTITPPDSVEQLHKIFQDEKAVLELKVCLGFLANKGAKVLSYIDIFQSRRPLTLKAFDYLEDLQIFLTTHLELPYDSCVDFFNDADDMPLMQKKELVNTFKEAFELAATKLQKYIDGAQPGIHFLHQIRLFNPSRISILSRNKNDYDAIPLMPEVCDEEFYLYFDKLAPQAVQAAGGLPIDIE